MSSVASRTCTTRVKDRHIKPAESASAASTNPHRKPTNNQETEPGFLRHTSFNVLYNVNRYSSNGRAGSFVRPASGQTLSSCKEIK